MLGFGAVAEFGIAEFAQQIGVIVIEAPSELTVVAGEDVLLSGASIGEAATVAELTAMMDPVGTGLQITEQLTYIELEPSSDSGASGALIIDIDTVSFEVGTAIAEGAIGEEGPIALFQRGTEILMFTRNVVVASGANTTEASAELIAGAPEDEIIARSRTLKKLAIAS
tara:strand:- start:193 stop:699 length:507 start_codon:yes stop_codon:yes gene_type:complete